MRSNLSGGNSNALPLEYFGVNSGRYSEAFGNAPVGNSATSHGVGINEHFAGPDLNVYEGHVGGARRRRVARKSTRRSARRSTRRRVKRSVKRSSKRSGRSTRSLRKKVLRKRSSRKVLRKTGGSSIKEAAYLREDREDREQLIE